MFRFAVVAGCAALVAEGRRTGSIDMGHLDGVATQTAPPGQCRRRRCPGTNPTIPPPTNAPGEPIQCDRSVPPTNLPAAIMSGRENLHYVGQGANACVYLSDSPSEAIKVSKWPSNPTLWSPRAECEKGQLLHAAACGDPDLIAQTEAYLPTCTGGHRAQFAGDSSYITMHRAGGLHPTTILRLGEGSSHKLPPAYQKIVFAELVSAIRLIHRLGFTHNDLHDGNVMLDLPDFLESFPWDRPAGSVPDPADAPSLPRLAIIDFGEMVPEAQGWVKDYKRDFNSLWDRTAFLANCPDKQARWWSTRGAQAGAEKFVNCLIDQWGVDNDFVETMWVAIHAAMEESTDQHIEDLYNTQFVQDHIPALDRRYSVGDSCNQHSLLQSLSTEEELARASSAPAGYDEVPGKCTGSWIENWSNGHYAHYGEDHHISGVDDCADTCDEHPECAGFYTKNGKCSHWRSGSIAVAPRSGHTCYRKQGGSAPAPAHHSSHHSSGGACEEVTGFTVQAGKCSGTWIEVWANGQYAHYGEDHHISGVADCADACDEHSDCAGFYTKNGKCSHWRSGSLSVSPAAGHCCYQK